MRRRTPLAVVPVVIAALAPLAACGDQDPKADEPRVGCPEVAAGEVTIVALDLAWDTDCLRAPAGEPFTVVVDNRDDEVNHDFRLATGSEILKTPLEAGPVVQRLEVPALDEGRYVYVCEIHPTMTGRLEVG